MEKKDKINKIIKVIEVAAYILVFLLGATYLVLLLCYTYKPTFSKSLEQWDHFGSAIGGVLGTLISLVVLILVYRTFQLQKEELTELRNSAQVQNQIATSSYAFNLVEDTLQLLEEYLQKVPFEGAKKNNRSKINRFKEVVLIDKGQLKDKRDGEQDEEISKLYDMTIDAYPQFLYDRINVDSSRLVDHGQHSCWFEREQINSFCETYYRIRPKEFLEIVDTQVAFILNHLITLGELLDSIKSKDERTTSGSKGPKTTTLEDAHYRFLIRKVQLYLGDDLCKALLIHSELDYGLQPKPAQDSCFLHILQAPEPKA